MTDGKDAVTVSRDPASRRDWGKWRDYRAMHFSGLKDAQLVVCKTCGRPTDKTSTKLCDGCWEVEHRLVGYLLDGGAAAARVILEALDGAALGGPCGECGYPHPIAHRLVAS